MPNANQVAGLFDYDDFRNRLWHASRRCARDRFKPKPCCMHPIASGPVTRDGRAS